MDKESGKKFISAEQVEIHRLNTISIGYREDEFLLVLNSTNKDFSDGYAVTIPVESMKQIVGAFQSCGIEYQENIGKNIGF